jgi:hypothetical protein
LCPTICSPQHTSQAHYSMYTLWITSQIPVPLSLSDKLPLFELIPQVLDLYAFDSY